MTIETTKRVGIPASALAGMMCWMLSACGGAPPPPPKVAEPPVEEEPPAGPAEKETLETGLDCVTAEGICETGHCVAQIKNDCAVPATCEFEVLGLCQAGGSRGEARAKAHETVPAGASTELPAQPDCEDAAVMGTNIEGLSCR